MTLGKVRQLFTFCMCENDSSPVLRADYEMNTFRFCFCIFFACLFCSCFRLLDAGGKFGKLLGSGDNAGQSGFGLIDISHRFCCENGATFC